MNEIEYVKNKEDLVELAKRSPTLLFDNYDEVKHRPGADQAYKIACEKIYRDEGN